MNVFANSTLTHDVSVAPSDAFHFGRNWQRYIDTQLNADRERIAADSLHGLVGDLTGKSFLDIGCGSGLFSLCAWRAGARRVVSIDVDPDSVSATQRIRSTAGDPDDWLVFRGSVLDQDFLSGITRADVVYSWGVLHHTGDMYPAIRNAASMVEPGGLLAIALYNTVSRGWLDSDRWLTIKRTYNHSGRAVQTAMEGLYWAYWLAGRLKNRQNPARTAREYRRSRGMALWTDLVDWLGGYPYEHASVEEILAFSRRELNLDTVQVLPVANDGLGNNQFVFRRPPE